jgi:hypothetical protein
MGLGAISECDIDAIGGLDNGVDCLPPLHTDARKKYLPKILSFYCVVTVAQVE